MLLLFATHESNKVESLSCLVNNNNKKEEEMQGSSCTTGRES
jgi:hypothetical protein